MHTPICEKRHFIKHIFASGTILKHLKKHCNEFTEISDSAADIEHSMTPEGSAAARNKAPEGVLPEAIRSGR